MTEISSQQKDIAHSSHKKVRNTFTLRVDLFNDEYAEFVLPCRYTIDKIKTHIFKNTASLKGLSEHDYQLGFASNDRLKIEFIKLIEINDSIRDSYKNDPENFVIELGLYPRETKQLKRQYSTSHVPNLRNMTISQSKKLVRQLGKERVLDSPNLSLKAVIQRPSLINMIETDPDQNSYESCPNSPRNAEGRSPLSMNKKEYEIEITETRERSNSTSSPKHKRTLSNDRQKIDKVEKSFRMRNFRNRSNSFTEILASIDEEENLRKLQDQQQINYNADDESIKTKKDNRIHLGSTKKRKKSGEEGRKSPESKRTEDDKKKRRGKSKVIARLSTEEDELRKSLDPEDLRSLEKPKMLKECQLGGSEPILLAISRKESPARVRLSTDESPRSGDENDLDMFDILELVDDSPPVQRRFSSKGNYRENYSRVRGNSVFGRSSGAINYSLKFRGSSGERFRSGSFSIEETKPNHSEVLLVKKPKSSELIRVPLMKPCVGFWVEINNQRLSIDEMVKTIEIINLNEDVTWFETHFVGKEHQNFISSVNKGEPVIISFLKERQLINGKKVKTFRIIIRSKKGNEKFFFFENTIKSANENRSKLFKSKGIQLNDVIRFLKLKNFTTTSTSTKHRLIKDPEVINDLINFEMNQVYKHYKIGILLCKEGQMTEEEMFSNEFGSELFDEFLEFLGKKVRLKGFGDYRGGLDTEKDATGTHSIYTKWKDYEIMFHVSTMLPFSTDNPQQLERKRHLGNDIVVLVFKEGNTPYMPNTISSDFNHVIIVVQPELNGDKVTYRISTGSKDGVGQFPPKIPDHSLFEKGEEFRQLLLCKLINGERMAYTSPKFLTKIQRTRHNLLKSIEDQYS